MKKADINTVAPVNIKTSIFNLRFLIHFNMDFYAIKRKRAVKRPFQGYIMHNI